MGARPGTRSNKHGCLAFLGGGVVGVGGFLGRAAAGGRDRLGVTGPGNKAEVYKKKA